jgi:hypothetical protein
METRYPVRQPDGNSVLGFRFRPVDEWTPILQPVAMSVLKAVLGRWLRLGNAARSLVPAGLAATSILQLYLAMDEAGTAVRLLL